jgi:hypothetical protein
VALWLAEADNVGCAGVHHFLRMAVTSARHRLQRR